jgi:hypothetical protein
MLHVHAPGTKFLSLRSRILKPAAQPWNRRQTTRLPQLFSDTSPVLRPLLASRAPERPPHISPSPTAGPRSAAASPRTGVGSDDSLPATAVVPRVSQAPARLDEARLKTGQRPAHDGFGAQDVVARGNAGEGEGTVRLRPGDLGSAQPGACADGMVALTCTPANGRPSVSDTLPLTRTDRTGSSIRFMPVSVWPGAIVRTCASLRLPVLG